MTNSYDLASRITSEILNGGAPTTYQYDVVDELTSDAVVSYSYDLNGNRTMAGYATGMGNQLTSDGTWSYFADKNGNIVQKSKSSEVWTFGFDNRNRMISAQDVTTAGLQMQATYLYDALGQRNEKDVWNSGGSTVTTRLAYDRSEIWADMNGSNALQMRYVRGEKVLELLARVSGAGTAAWLLTDRMGSIRNIVDNTGAVIDTLVYDGYGNVASESNVANGGAYKFDGYRLDAETGLYRPDPTTARYYGPATGRWWSVDPISFTAGDSNLWRYVQNSPTNRTDPTANEPLTLADASDLRDALFFIRFFNLQMNACPFMRPRTDEECCEDIRNDPVLWRITSKPLGQVFCCDGRLVACKLRDIGRSIWGEVGDYIYGMFDDCLWVHERHHLKTAVYSKCRDAFLAQNFAYAANEKLAPENERSAYKVQLECLIRALRNCKNKFNRPKDVERCQKGILAFINDLVDFSVREYQFNRVQLPLIHAAMANGGG